MRLRDPGQHPDSKKTDFVLDKHIDLLDIELQKRRLRRETQLSAEKFLSEENRPKNE